MVAILSHNIPPERFAAECAQGLVRAGRRASLIRQAGAGRTIRCIRCFPESGVSQGAVYAWTKNILHGRPEPAIQSKPIP